ncbi:cadherin domain-containing protein [Roseibium sp. MMSF_3412]|uniref:cadherin domain-containing protein n=1 Tax=Roseibium sp. MMSF_3412 TaxID=3046712 RepID=UPI00273E06BA|nr:cadherin domain-containing protein [Roseibium sp. MMSF_3412]
MAEDTENRGSDNKPLSGEDKDDRGSTLGSDEYLHSGLLDAKDRHLDKAHDYHLDQDMGVSSEQVISNLHLGSHLEKPLPDEDLKQGASSPVSVAENPGPGEFQQAEPHPVSSKDHLETAVEPEAETRVAGGETATRSGSSASAPAIERIDPLDIPVNNAQADDPGGAQAAAAAATASASSRSFEQGSSRSAEPEPAPDTRSELSDVSDIDSQQNTVDEDAAVGALTGITANADASDASGVTYSLVDDADGLFAIDPATGVVTVAGELDAETAGSHDIVVRALAADGQSSTETFTITVGDVNETGISAVSDIDATANQIREDAAAGTAVGVTAQATDEDATATVSYEVDDPRFVIDDNGVVTLAEGASFDADTEGDVSFTVTATSSDGSSSSETFSISVTDLNDETPTDIALSDSEVDENSSGGTVVATLSVSDADLNDTHVYQIADDPSGFFEITGNEIRVKDGALLDHEAADEHTLTLTVTDAAGQSHSEDVTISVNDVNEAPQNINLNALDTAADFSASDGYTSSSSLSDMGLEADTTVVTVSFSTASDIDTAQTLFETGGNYYGLNIVIEDGVLNVYAGEGNNVELSAPIEAGTDYNLALELNKETGTLTLLMSDELPLNDMNSDNSLADLQTGWTDQDWDGGNSLGVGNLADHSQGHVGGDFLGEIADEGVSVYADATLESYLKPVVDENSEGGTVVARLSTTDPDDGDTHTYEITDDPSGFFEIVGDEIRVKEGAVLDFETAASHEITVTVTDAGGLSHSEAFSIAVQNVNEAPLALALDTGNKADFTAADGYTSRTSISELGLETDSNVFAMSFTTAEDVATAQTLFETGGNVYGLNVVIENGHVNVYAGDSNNLELSAEISPGTDYNFLLELNKEAGTITLLLSDELAIGEMDQSNSLAAQRSGWPDGDWDGGDSIGVGNLAGHSQGHVGGDFLGEIHDEGLSVYSDATLDNFNTGTLSENTAGAVVGALAVSDPDNGDTHTYSVSDDRFEVLGGTLKLKDGAVIDFESEPTVDVTVTATDVGGNTVSKTFSVDFDDVAEDLVLSDGGVVFTDEGVSETSINGGAGDDTITAHEDGGVIDGSAGDDTLIGGAGDDDLDGGTGLDTVVFTGERDDYDVTENPDGSFTVTDTRDGAPDGTDTVRNIETLRFADGDVLAGDLIAQDITSVADTNATENTIAEDAAAGSLVGITAFAEDANVSDTVSYSVDDGRFDIDADGKVTVAEAAAFDAETEGALDVVVTAVSSDGTSSQQTFTITVTDVDEFDVSSVLDVDASANTVSEDADAGTEIGVTAFAADDDVSDTVSYTVDDDRFDVAEDGTVTVADGATFDAETEASIDVTVTAQSTDGSTSSETFTVEVGNVNDNAPTDILIAGNPGNLIQNGSFEAFDVSKGSWTHAKEDPSGSWSSEGPLEVWNNLGSVDATDGDKHLELDSDGGVNSISQSVETTLGQVYDLSFDAMARSSSETSTVEVYWNDELVTRFDPETGDWEAVDLQVVGTGGNDVLEFRETAEDNNSYGALLDNVSLTEIPMTIAEGVNGAVIGSVSTTDADARDKHSYKVSDDRFEIVANGIGVMVLKLRDTESLDRESDDSIVLTVTTTDSGGLTYSEDVTVFIADISEYSVSSIEDTDATANTLAENAGAGDEIGVSVAATDEDATDTVSYTVDDDRFTVADDGTVTVAEGATFDAETEATVTITVTAESSDGSTSSETFEVEIEDVDEEDVSAVIDTDASANSVAENAATGTDVGVTASASDGDVSDTVSYSVDDSRFDIADDGTVTVADGATFDAETEGMIDVVVTVTSTDGSSSQQTFTITVADINEFAASPVQDTDAAENAIAEDAVEGTGIGITAFASDDDVSDDISYSVDDNRFEVADDGTVTVAAGASFDAETESSIDVTVTAESSDGSTAEETFTIDVSDVNETSVSKVTDTNAADNTIAEDAGEGTSVGVTAFAEDADATDTVSYSVDDNRFEVADDGTVTVASGASFDFETEPSISLTITATSSDGTSSEQVVDIGVSDVAETFSLQAGQTVFVDEGVAEPTIYGTDAAETITAHDDGSRIFSGGGADTIHGGKGDDHIEFGTGADTVYAGDGNDFIDDEVGTRPSTEANLLDGGAGNDVIYGGGGDDTLVGGTGNDSLSGEEDDDTLQGDAGNDRISGGSGTDTAVYSGNRDDYDIVENSNGSYTITDTRPDSPDGTDTVYDVEVFSFADGDVLAGDLVPEDISAVSDADASENAISEDAAAGDSVGISVSAEDTNVSDSVSYSVDDARFEVSDNGEVTVAAGAEFDYETEPSIDVVVTATSTDGSTSEETFTIDVADAVESMELDDTGVTMTDTGVAESSITGGSGNDTITAHDDGGDMDGGDGTDTVMGGAGEDTLDGGAGADNDTLQGGEGSDTYMLRGDGRADILSDTGTTGTDRIILAEDTGTEFELEDTFNAATQGIEEIDGSGVSGETLRAQRSDSEIDWDFTGVDLTGVDQIEGRDRDDSITGSASDDNILGGAGDDTLAGSGGDDTLDGGTGTDTASFSGNLADYTVTEDAGTVTIVDNRDGSPDGTDTLTNVENFEFADGTYSLGDIVNLAPTDIALSANESLSITEVVGGDAVVTGEIVSDGFGNQSVDHWSISHDGGDLTIDVLAAGYESGSLDSQIYLYRDNGGGDYTLIASNDDGAAGSDGSTRSFDSYLAETGLEAGTYMVVIGSYPLDTGEALDSGSDYPASGSSTGPYQITVTGDAEITGISENPVSGEDWGDPGSNAVLVSNGAGEETIAAGSELTGIETITDENSGDSFHFSFLDDGDGAFQINSDTGSVSLAREHDAGTAKSDTVTIQVADAAGATLDKTVGIELGTAESDRIIGTDEDDIVFGFGGDDSIDGGAGDDMLVLSGNQADYAIYDNGNGSHTIVDTRDGSPDGTKTVSNVEDFTFADGKVATDDLSLSSEITLLDENASGNQIHETADAGSEVGISVSALTPGEGALTYALSDDRFSIDSDGVVTIADHAFFDSQVESSIDLTVTATAEDGKEASETFTVNVNGSYSYEMTGGLGNGSFTGSDDRSYSVDGVGGNDIIETGDQNDRIEGGSVAGNDQITGNGGRDLLFGDGGDDTISGGSGDDIIVGGAGDDTLNGGDGSDLFMHGLGDGNDVIEGGAGTAWTDVIDLGGGPGVTAAGEYGTDWTVTITNGSVEKTDTENSRLELSKDAEGSIDFSDGSKIDFAQIEEIRW